MASDVGSERKTPQFGRFFIEAVSYHSEAAYH